VFNIVIVKLSISRWYCSCSCYCCCSVVFIRRLAYFYTASHCD